MNFQKHELSHSEYQRQAILYDCYRKKVIKISNKQPLTQLENYSKRGRNKFHLDHIISIRYGFANNIDPEIIGNIKNLRFIPAEENIKKSSFLEQESSDMIFYLIEEGTL